MTIISTLWLLVSVPLISQSQAFVSTNPDYRLTHVSVPSTCPTRTTFCNTKTTHLFSSVSSEPKRKQATSTVTRTASNVVKQPKKRRRNCKKKGDSPSMPNSKRTPGPGRSLTQEELSEHVSARYNQGKGGPLDSKSRSRGILNQATDQAKFLKELNQRPALVLNADYQPLSYLPLSLWSWQDAIKAVFGGKVQVVDVYPDIFVRAANLEVPLPSVIALTDYVKQTNQRPAFTRRHVFLRDEYKCQYCNHRFHTADLSLDHVHPRCMGGQLNWENAVTSCLKCNGRKGSTPVSQLRHIGMRLVREPQCPTQMELAHKAARMVPRRVHPTWKPYLGIAATPTTGTEGDEAFIDNRYFEESD